MPRYLHLATAAAAALGRAAAQNDTAAPTMEPTDSPDGAAVATVNPAALYSLDRAMPLGATCKEVNVEDGDCDLFAADCLCDVTAGACDLNCCCDTDCDALQIAQFEMRGACVDTGRTFTNECYSAQDTGLASVNARYPMSSSSTADAALDGLFCVMYDNSEKEGSYYGRPSLPEEWAAEYESSGYPLDVDSRIGVLVTETDDAETPSAYSLGDVVTAGVLTGGNAERSARHRGYLPQVAPGALGECEEANWARFGVADKTACVRKLPTSDADAFAAACADGFGFARLSTDLVLGKGPGSSRTTAADADKWVAVSAGEARFVDAQGGAVAAFADLDCVAYAAPAENGTAHAGCAAPPLNATAVEETDDGRLVCRNALVGLKHTVYYNVYGRISGSVADVNVTDVYAPALGGAPLLVEQAFEVDWVPAKPAPEGGAAGSIQVPALAKTTRARSGAPGYLPAAPLLAGANVVNETISSKGWVVESGLRLLGGDASAGGLKCVSPHANDRERNVGRTAAVAAFSHGPQVRFNEDVTSACSIDLTRGELKELCEGGGPHASAAAAAEALVVPVYLEFLAAAGVDVVGKFGNADPMDVSQWLELVDATGLSGAAPVWDEMESTCSGLPAAVHVRLAWSVVGERGAPMARMLAAEYEYAEEIWTHTATGAFRQASASGDDAWDAITAKPTSLPTPTVPVPLPTAVPTSVPTSAPSHVPTAVPTPAPSISPQPTVNHAPTSTPTVDTSLDVGPRRTFALTSTVTWVHIDNTGLQTSAPPNPPALFSVPHDIFYPFEAYSAAPGRHALSLWAVAVAVLAMGQLAAAR